MAAYGRRRRRGPSVRGALLLAVLCLLLLPRRGLAAGDLPAFSNYVVDEAGVVPDDVEQQVDASLGAYQKRSGNQVAVAVVRTTGGRAIEEYSLALATTWGVGQQGKDNGVLIVIASADRRVRIEVGRGLQSVLPNQRAAGIVNDGLVQRLGRGDVGGAVIFATEAIRRALGDVAVAAQPSVTATVAPPVPVAPVQPGPRPAPYPSGFDRTQPVGGGGSSSDTITRDSGFPGWIFLAVPVFVVLGLVTSVGTSRRSGYRSSGPMFWGQGLGHGGGWGGGSSAGSSGSWSGSGGDGGGGGSGGGFSGGGGGGFDGGGASGSW